MIAQPELNRMALKCLPIQSTHRVLHQLVSNRTEELGSRLSRGITRMSRGRLPYAAKEGAGMHQLVNVALIEGGEECTAYRRLV